MIDYSVYMTPNPMDDAAAPMAYGRAQMRESMTFDKFVKHIAEHNGVFSRGTVQGVILDMCECLVEMLLDGKKVQDMCECLVEMLLDGKKVQLGALGDFFISLSTTPAESLDAFTAANIKGINVVFTPGADFEGMRDKAVFNPVASRLAQAATLKAEKSGSTIVDLEAAKQKPAASEGTGA